MSQIMCRWIFALVISVIFVTQCQDSLLGQTFDPSKVDLAEFNPAQFKEYEKRLNSILKTRKDEEKEFVSKVVHQVRIGKIPSKLVSTSFQWVRNRRPDTQYPFVYFERVLRIQATKLGIGKEVPKFDYGIYSARATRSRGSSR